MPKIRNYCLKNIILSRVTYEQSKLQKELSFVNCNSNLEKKLEKDIRFINYIRKRRNKRKND